MSKRLDKKKLKRQTTAIESPIAETSASKETINFFIQYQYQEYLETEIISRVKESCLLNGASSDELNTISINPYNSINPLLSSPYVKYAFLS